MGKIFEILANLHGEWFGWDSAVAEIFQQIADALTK